MRAVDQAPMETKHEETNRVDHTLDLWASLWAQRHPSPGSGQGLDRRKPGPSDECQVSVRATIFRTGFLRMIHVTQGLRRWSTKGKLRGSYATRVDFEAFTLGDSSPLFRIRFHDSGRSG